MGEEDVTIKVRMREGRGEGVPICVYVGVGRPGVGLSAFPSATAVK
jgi:hypothetical protein